MFRRRRREPQEPLADEDAPDAADADGGAGAEPAAPPSGPWDEADVPADGLPRLDFGALRVFVPPGLTLHMQAAEDRRTVISVVLQDGPSTLQLAAFAAPRTEGLWTEVRAEMAESLRASGGAETVEGSFGPELRARVPAGDRPGTAPVRFVGIDGPRWFLRATFTGPSATDPPAGRRLEEALRQVVVVRGGEAMTRGELLPMVLPGEVAEAATGPEHDPFRRGPEITEVR